MTVRAKFRCSTVTPSAGGHEIHLYAVTGGSPENDEFFQYTPAGHITLSVVNPETAERFEPGKTYFIDFSEAQS